MEKVEIQLSRSNAMRAIIIGSVLALSGVYCTFFFNGNGASELIVMVVGVFLLAFGIWGVYINMKKLKDKRPGIVVDENGIFENSNDTSFGQIPWDDITGIGALTKIDNNHIVPVYLVDNDKYMKNYSGLKLKMLKIAVENIGTPVGIMVAPLDCKGDALTQILYDGYRKYKGE